LKLTEKVQPRLGVRLQVAPVGTAEELLPELAVIAKERPDALFLYPDVVLSAYPRPQQLADFALKALLPTMHAFRFFVDAGGLMSYGAATSSRSTRWPQSRSPRSWMARGRASCRSDRPRGSSWSSTSGPRGAWA